MMVNKDNNKLNLGEKMIIKRKNFLIAVSVFVGCSSSTPTVVRNGGTETTQVGGVTTASMRHQSCFRAGRETICSDANGNQVMNRNSGIISKGVVSHASNGTIQQTVVQSDAETATDAGVKAYPYVKGLIKLIK